MDDVSATRKAIMRHVILVFYLFLSVFAAYILYLPADAPDMGTQIVYPTKEVSFDSSLAIYIIVGHNHSLKPDCRGKYWEFQLPYVRGGNIMVYYVSDYYGSVNGIKFLMPEWESSYFPDKNMVKRTKYSWMHFAKYHNRVKWLLRITTDTFLNISSLVSMINDLETKINPMKEIFYAYNVYEFTEFLFPHGGPGWLASNAAALRDANNLDVWDNYSRYSIGDDVAFKHYLNACGHQVTDFIDTRFLVKWPKFQDDIVYSGNFSQLPTCPHNFTITPDKYVLKPTVIRESVSQHMHEESMDKVADILARIPGDVLFSVINNQTQLCVDRSKYYVK